MTRPFDLKAALSGEPILWPDDGLEYTVTGYNRESHTLRVEEKTGCYRAMSLDGEGWNREKFVMAPRKVKKTVWVNLYDTHKHCDGFACWKYDSKQDALDAVASDAIATAVPVEIEVEE